MTISADTLALLIASGIDGERLVEIVRAIEADNGPKQGGGAARQRAYRERQKAGNVTCDVTRDVTRDVTPPPLVPLDGPPKDISNPPLNPPNPPVHHRARGASPKPIGGFAEFWAAYPRKSAKAAAERAWPKACQRMPPAEIIEATRRYAATGPDPEFTPHPATWLNAARFEDEPDEQLPRTPRQSRPGEHRSGTGRDIACDELLADIAKQRAAILGHAGPC